jgi:purine nucleoside phosphorylase
VSRLAFDRSPPSGRHPSFDSDHFQRLEKLKAERHRVALIGGAGLLSLIDANETQIERAGVNLLSYRAGQRARNPQRRAVLHRAGQRASDSSTG